MTGGHLVIEMGYDCRTRKNSENVKQREKIVGSRKKSRWCLGGAEFFYLIKVVMNEIYSQGTKEVI